MKLRMKSAVVAGIAATAVMSGLAMSGTASAAPTPAARTTATVVAFGTHALLVRPLTISSWTWTAYGSEVWGADVRITSGEYGAFTTCSGLSTPIYGPLVGPGYWIFGGNCTGHGTLTSAGYYEG